MQASTLMFIGLGVIVFFKLINHFYYGNLKREQEYQKARAAEK